MARDSSLTVREAVYGQETDEVFIALLTIDHPDLDDPIRVSRDGVDTESRGDTYISFPFRIKLPSEEKDKMPQVKLEIDNVTREIVTVLRGLNSSPTVKLEIVVSSDPDQVEAGPYEYKLRNATYDAGTVSGTLKQPAIDEAPFPSHTFNPSTTAALFKNL